MTAAVLTPTEILFPDHCRFGWCLGTVCGQDPGEGNLDMHLGRPSATRGLGNVIIDVTPVAFTEDDGSFYGVPMVTIGIETDTHDAQIDLPVREALALSLAIAGFGNAESPIGDQAVFEGVAGGEPSGATLTVTRIGDLEIGTRNQRRSYPGVELKIYNPDGNPKRGTIQLFGFDAVGFSRYVTAAAAEVSA